MKDNVFESQDFDLAGAATTTLFEKTTFRPAWKTASTSVWRAMSRPYPQSQRHFPTTSSPVHANHGAW